MATDIKFGLLISGPKVNPLVRDEPQDCPPQTGGNPHRTHDQEPPGWGRAAGNVGEITQTEGQLQYTHVHNRFMTGSRDNFKCLYTSGQNGTPSKINERYLSNSFSLGHFSIYVTKFSLI